MTTHTFGMRWEGKRHQIAEPSKQERRVRRLLGIAGRTYAKATDAFDGFNQRAIELHGTQHEPNRKGIR